MHVQIFDESFKFNAVSASLPIVVTSLLPSTTEVHPPSSNTHVLHTPLELCNIYIIRFEPSWIIYATHVSRVGLKLSFFGQIWSGRQRVLFMTEMRGPDENMPYFQRMSFDSHILPKIAYFRWVSPYFWRLVAYSSCRDSGRNAITIDNHRNAVTKDVAYSSCRDSGRMTKSYSTSFHGASHSLLNIDPCDRTTLEGGPSLGSTWAILGEARTQSTHISTIPYYTFK
jgi:hypothetical protein